MFYNQFCTDVCTTGDNENVKDTDGPSAKQQCTGFKIVGDNLDKSVKARYMRLGGSHNQSLHYFHSFAVLDRIDFSSLPNIHPQQCLNSPEKRALSLLPSSDDDKALKKLFVTHVSRILTTHLPVFKLMFEDVTEWHIEHEYYKQMSTKSEVVSTLCNLHKNHIM